MKANELKQKSAAELQATLVELRKEQFNLRFQTASQQLESPHSSVKFAVILLV